MRVFLRADASVAMGTGHVMRCIALAQALRVQGHEVQAAACLLPTALEERLGAEEIPFSRLGSERMSPEDLAETLGVAEACKADCVVLDGNGPPRWFQEGLRKVRPLCVVDDGAVSDGYTADLLLNPNLFATEEMYEGQDIDRMLIGHKYAVLRQEFWSQHDKPASLKTRRILITMGGSDPDNVTGKVIRAMKKLSLERLEIRAIAGAGNPYWETLQVQASRTGHEVELLQNVVSMREQFEWADVCVSAAGSTALELACVGVAGIYLVLVDNQEAAGRAIRKFGFGRVLGWHEDLNEEAIRAAVRDVLTSTEERDRMGRWGRELVDGQGALRVAAAIGELV